MASMAPWRELLQNVMQIHKHLRHSTHLQLVCHSLSHFSRKISSFKAAISFLGRFFKATVRPDGRPANRTLVFRGFVDGTNQMQFTTDSRSHKIEEIRHCPFGEICYYFTDSWEQFRIHGILEVIGSTESDPSKKTLREKVWFNSSPRSRGGFAAPHPGLPKESDSETPQLDPDQGPLDTFCVLTLEPKEVDYYHAKEMRRILFNVSDMQNDGCNVWSQQEVNP